MSNRQKFTLYIDYDSCFLILFSMLVSIVLHAVQLGQCSESIYRDNATNLISKITSNRQQEQA